MVAKRIYIRNNGVLFNTAEEARTLKERLVISPEWQILRVFIGDIDECKASIELSEDNP